MSGPIRMVRGYDAAERNRLTDDWTTTVIAPNADIRNAHTALLARARDVYNNTSHVKGYVAHRLPAQILGSYGLRLVPQVKRSRGGALNNTANTRIQEAWERWGQLGSCTVDGGSTWLDVQKTILEAVVRDGECLVRFVRGRSAENPYNFALQILEAEHLDSGLDARAPNGDLIVMGKELSKWKRPRAYHILEEAPNGFSFQFQHARRVRVPAQEILHPYVRNFPSQIRGITWFHAALGDARMMAKYREAELIAARMAASKAAMLTAEDDHAPAIEGYQSTEVDGGERVFTIEDRIEPGQLSAAPPGWRFNMIDPTHPNGNFAGFEKAILRGIASALGATYHGFANDLEGVNYSSARLGAIDEREVWRMIQTWFVNHVARPIFAAWLDMALLGDLRLPAQLRDDYVAGVKFQGRGYSWVDPAKEAQAAILQINEGLASRTQVLTAQGTDFGQVVQELTEERDLLKAAGIGESAHQVNPNGDQSKPDDDEDGEDDSQDGQPGGDKQSGTKPGGAAGRRSRRR